ncbi:MAG: acetyl-CoA carboxylase biotin carboxyl carrier protein subunit [Chloroflexi bacterium]|nr:acetyl-CoA carboxylase biotin carboxyl carrier protein subunit [Chloroflexota bacterium]
MSPRRYRITVDGNTHEVEVGDVSASPIRVNVDGVDYDVEVPGKPTRGPAPARASAPSRPTAQPSAPASGTSAPSPGASANAMTAVMPGRVMSVAVSVGDTVSRGDLICIIEAMKMEQKIGANRDGTISAVRVSAGDSVAHGQILVEFE